MASIIEGYSYDIFISYRQKDNKYGGWVTEFVDNLKRELEATFKEDVSVYFDINPHDGLLETHDVVASLKDKLKCLVFIPIISRTYCDPKSFAWEHEFKAFVEQASKDNFGLKVKLPNGNVASRVLPVRIYDIDSADNKLCESVLGGVIRGVEFIFKSTGVNRPLTSSDNPDKNLYKTFYRDQINKVSNAIKEIISGMKGEPLESESEPKEVIATIEKPSLQEKTIIVLPFENISPDPDQEYFSDGLTEEIISDLSKIEDLLVISRSSAMTFKGTKKTIPEIARAVHVRYVLEGSVRKSGNSLRITAQLIDAETDTHLWAEKYNGILDDIFDIQEKVSGSIVNELELKLSLEERNKIMDRPIKDTQAFEFYLRAKQEINNFTENSLNKAVDYLQQALKIEGNNSSLYAELAHAYYQFWNLGIRIEETDLETATAYVKKAFELNHESPDGHFVSGLLEITGGVAKRGVLHFKKVIQVSPNHANALLWLALLYGNLGFAKECNQYLARYLKTDPFSPFQGSIPTGLNIFNGEFELAEEQSRQLGSDVNSLLVRIWALLYTRKLKAAYAELNHIPKEIQSSSIFKIEFVRLYASMQKHTEVNNLMDEKFILWAKKDFQYSFFIAEAYAMLNNKVDALNWLENAVNHGYINYHFLSKHNPLLKSVRGEERFKKLMERVKYEWENFNV